MAASDPHSGVLAEQQRRNRATQGHWQLFADHRRRVTELMIAAAQATGQYEPRLVVLGAGNSNDLDLPRLLASFCQIHLVDWDDSALVAGVERQGAENLAIACHGGIDLANSAPLTAISEPVHVVASTCLISQLIEGVVQAAGEGRPEHLALIQSVRLSHLQRMAEILAPGGVGLLISDLVSSETALQLLTAKDFEVAPLVASCIAQQNFFTGLNPAVLLNLFATDPILCRLTEQIEPLSPWRWNLGSRVYAVYGIRFRRRAGE